MKRTLFTVIALVALATSVLVLMPQGDRETCSRGDDGCPAFDRSPAIETVLFHDATLRIAAPGSDNWPITWAADDALYTSWGDGGGFGGDNTTGRVSLGIGRILGEPADYRGVNIAGGVNSIAHAPFQGKSEGILAIRDTLYLWRAGDGSGKAAFKFSQLYRSTDYGRSWNETPVSFVLGRDFRDRDLGFFSPTFAQFGRGYDDARDDFVYIYAPEVADSTHWDVQVPGHVALLRVPRGRLSDESAYRFFAGHDADSAVWTSHVGDRVPVWADSIGGVHRLAVSYNRGLNRYFMTTMIEDRLGALAIYDAPEPWGPWTLAHRERDPDRWGSKSVIFTFVNKWSSPDGTRFVMVYTRDDHWATIEGQFVLRDPTRLRGSLR